MQPYLSFNMGPGDWSSSPQEAEQALLSIWSPDPVASALMIFYIFSQIFFLELQIFSYVGFFTCFFFCFLFVICPANSVLQQCLLFQLHLISQVFLIPKPMFYLSKYSLHIWQMFIFIICQNNTLMHISLSCIHSLTLLQHFRNSLI